MNRAWDGDRGGRDQWIAWMEQIAVECLRCAKPGAHALVWALPRTSHWTATAWENADWEVRDVVHHIFGTGFPKSLNVSAAIDKLAGVEREVIGRNPNWRDPDANAEHHERWNNAVVTGDLTAPATDAAKQWAGWHSAMKPAAEHWIMFRKPLSESNIAKNVLKHGTGAINVDATRVGTTVETWPSSRSYTPGQKQPGGHGETEPTGPVPAGRFPANVTHDGSDEVLAEFPYTKSGGTNKARENNGRDSNCQFLRTDYITPNNVTPSDEGSAARFFNQLEPDDKPLGRFPANVTHDGSDEVLAEFPYSAGQHSQRRLSDDVDSSWFGGDRLKGPVEGKDDPGSAARFFNELEPDEARFLYAPKADKADRAGSKHPTVKSQKLMEWLCRLITPKGGVILDPFAGSGSTGLAACAQGFSTVLIEQDAEYIEDIKRRLELWF